ncbi:MAG: hypothetical protein ACRD3O_10200 [Terriglobia bacterium]
MTGSAKARSKQSDSPSKAAKIIAATAAGFSNRQIAALVNCHERYIRLCRQRARRQDTTASLYRLLAQLRQRTLWTCPQF